MKTEKQVILIGHKARQGKDSFARALATEIWLYGPDVKILSFATALKEIVADTFGISRKQLDYAKNLGRFRAFLKYRKLLFLVIDFRKILQQFGDGKMKHYFGKNVWKDIVEKQISETDAKVIIIPDFRFKNELIEGALTIRIERPGTTLQSTHKSEVDLDDFEYNLYLLNDGDLKDLSHKAFELAKATLKGKTI